MSPPRFPAGVPIILIPRSQVSLQRLSYTPVLANTILTHPSNLGWETHLVHVKPTPLRRSINEAGDQREGGVQVEEPKVC